MTNNDPKSKWTMSPILVSGIIWAIATILLLLLANFINPPSGIGQALIIIAGMTLLAAFSSFHHFIENREQISLVYVSFNADFVRQSLPESPSRPIEPAQKKDWEITPAQLIGVDNALALAKLRIEIEQELRRLAHDNNVDLSGRPLSPIALSEELLTRKLLEPTLFGALREVMKACNQGIHGAEVSDEIAASVVSTGGQIITQLRSFQF